MKDYNLTIQINSPWIIEKLNYLWKANSVLFVDYSPIVADIFRDFQTDKDFNLFRFKLITTCRDYVKIKKYHNWYRLESDEINISQNILWLCLPRKIRVKYFKRDNLYEKYYLKEDLHHYYI